LSAVISQASTWNRGQAIARLREALVKLTDDGHSLCQVASERGIFCHGFRRWNAREFDERFRNAIGRSTHLSRAQMEEFANVWQLAEQIRLGVTLACDAQLREHGTCRGWDEFSNADLSRFCNDILGQDIEVVK
jgi:hypothetical protein